MKSLKLILIACSLIFFSFKDRSPEIKVVKGTYGICDCVGTETKSPTFALTLKDDMTFHYINTFDPAKKEDVSGTYTVNKGLIKLQSNSELLYDKWKVEKNNLCLKSRAGLVFSRLCLKKPCDK